jgi:hypothetical protein
MSYTILTDNDNKITQPLSIKIELMNHQKAMVHKMLDIEQTGSMNVLNYSMKTYSNMVGITGNRAEIYTNVAILGDKVGSGKTLMIISLLTVKKIIKERDIEMGGSQFYSVKIKPSSPLIKINLIVVPHKILPQWKDAFEKFSPSLRVYSISLNKEIDRVVKKKKEIKKNWNDEELEYADEEIIKEKLEEYDVVLVGETMYKRFYKSCKNYRFNRILIDEADTIKLPRDMSCQFNFLWLITGTPKGLFYSNKPFISKIFKDDNLNIISNFVIKNEDTFIEQSIKLPHPKRFKIKCITPKELEIIKDLIPPSVLQMINAGNSEQAIKALNCNVDTNENILQVITKNIVDSIANKEIELEAETKKHYPINLQKEHEQKIKFIEGQIEKLKSKYENIKKRIYQLNDTNCPVCMGEFTNPVVVSCCNNTFCFDCLAVSLGELKNNKCPYCKQAIEKKQIHVFQSDTIGKTLTPDISSNKYDMKDKLDVLIDLVQKKPNGSFMIFAGYMETFHKIETKLKDLSIPFYILKGQSSTVKKYVDDFRDKKVRVLMLNAQFFGAGMNLQMATDIIIYHRFTKEMEEQIIGRAQRLGRSISEPLNVYYLLHDNESDNIEDNFKFEDKSDIHYMDWLEQEQKQDKHINNHVVNDNNNNLPLDDEKIYTINMENSDYEKYNIDSNDNINNFVLEPDTPNHLQKVYFDESDVEKKNKPIKNLDVDTFDDLVNDEVNLSSKKIFIKNNENIVVKKKSQSGIHDDKFDDKFDDNLDIYENFTCNEIKTENKVSKNDIPIFKNNKLIIDNSKIDIQDFDIDQFEVIS